MITDFNQFAEENNLSEDHFPYSENGPRHIQRIEKTFLTLIVVSFISIAINFFGKFFESFELGSGRDLPDIVSSILNVISKTVRLSYVALDYSMRIIAWSVFLILVFFVLAYLMNVFKRARSFERQVIKSDFEANNLRKSILRATSAKRTYHETRSKTRKEAKDGSLSLSSESQLEAEKAFLKLRVNVNVRQSLDSDEIEKFYKISIDVPYVQDEADLLLKKVENVEQIATRLKKGKVNFGSQTLSADRKMISYIDTIIVEDKYAPPVVDEVEEVVEYETSFPIELFTDNSEKIAKLKSGALKWANQTAKSLDSMMATKKTAAKRIGIDVGNSNILVTYEMSFSLDPSRFDSMGDQFDQIFKTKGCSASLKEGNILITIPLPKKYKIPIDVPTLYKNAFL